MTLDEALHFRSLIEDAASGLTAVKSVESADLFPEWSAEKDYKTGDRVRYNGILYRYVQDATANPTWTPEIVPALCEPLADGHTGTIDDPIAGISGMRYFEGLYYKDGDKVYKCIRQDTNDGTRLYYMPSQLAENYFEEVAA